jgi:hypothetical protein
MGFNAASEKDSRSPETAFECALELMRSGRYAPAFRCLSALSAAAGAAAESAGFLPASSPGSAGTVQEVAYTGDCRKAILLAYGRILSPYVCR